MARQRHADPQRPGPRDERRGRAELTDGELEGRRQIAEYFRFLKAEVPGFAQSAIVEIAPQVGIRETRRIQGLYALRRDDILGSARFDDNIGLNAWPMEMHADGRIEWAFPRDEGNAYNHLPWRMLVPQSVDNLLVAGRCASMTHEGQSAARASGGCFVMGQAAGTAAASLGSADAFAQRRCAGAAEEAGRRRRRPRPLSARVRRTSPGARTMALESGA
jgi:hypothetical protein